MRLTGLNESAMSNEPTEDKQAPGPLPAEEAAEQSYGWLTALRAKLGLPGTPTLRPETTAVMNGSGLPLASTTWPWICTAAVAMGDIA